METNIYITLASCLITFTLAFVEPASASAIHNGHHHKNNKRVTKPARQRARAQRKTSRRAISYVCPMHPDIRAKSSGTCPKCLMDLVAERALREVEQR